MITGYAFIDKDMNVVNAISGDVPAETLKAFESDYAILFGSEFSVPILNGVSVWIGGKYNPDTGVFYNPNDVIEGSVSE